MVRYEDIKLTPSDALEIFLKEYPGRNVKKIELDRKSHSYVYKVKGYDDEKKYKLYINPDDGSIIELKEKINRKIIKDLNKDNTEKIQNLVDKSLKDAGEGSILDEWSLEMDKGLLILEVEIDLKNGNDVEYLYDLESEKLLKRYT